MHIKFFLWTHTHLSNLRRACSSIFKYLYYYIYTRMYIDIQIYVYIHMFVYSYVCAWSYPAAFVLTLCRLAICCIHLQLNATRSWHELSIAIGFVYAFVYATNNLNRMRARCGRSVVCHCTNTGMTVHTLVWNLWKIKCL